MSSLSTSELMMPADFPVEPFQRVYLHVNAYHSGKTTEHEQFTGAMHAIRYRFLALCDEGEAFTASVEPASSNSGRPRYLQEKALFGFFSNGFATYEALFYALFSIGAMISPVHFAFSSGADRQRVSPKSCVSAYKGAFPDDPINSSLATVTESPSYQEWREIRNILTHRSAPGRTVFVAIGSDEDLPARWKINNIPLDRTTAPIRRQGLADLLQLGLLGAATFLESRLQVVQRGA